VVDRHDDELAERRASGARPNRGREAAEGASAPAGPGQGGALPLQWDETPPDLEEGETGPVEERAAGNLGETIDLTERADRSGRDDLDVWSDVLRRRPVEAARLTGHPSAAGERLEAAPPRTKARPRRRTPETAGGQDDFARALLDRRGRRGRGNPGGEGEGEGGEGGTGAEGETPPPNVRRLRPVWPEPEGPAGPKGFGAELATRVVTGVVVAAAALLIFNAGPGPADGLCAVIVGLAVLELCTALRSQGWRPAVPIALVGSVALVIAPYKSGLSAFPETLSIVVIATFLWHLAQVVRGRPAPGIAMTLLPIGYIGILGGFAGEILGFKNGVGILLGTACCTVAYDVCGYLVGSRLGRRRIAPAISPNKTVEGLLGGMAASIVVAVVIVGSITPWDHLTALALGTTVAVLAPLGDLCESMLKRDLGVKDLGGLLPGHGGVLDRFDAILFVLPAVYYLVRLLEIV
jgi:CDP-diglyceride synthetase